MCTESVTTNLCSPVTVCGELQQIISSTVRNPAGNSVQVFCEIIRG